MSNKKRPDLSEVLGLTIIEQSASGRYAVGAIASDTERFPDGSIGGSALVTIDNITRLGIMMTDKKVMRLEQDESGNVVVLDMWP